MEEYKRIAKKMSKRDWKTLLTIYDECIKLGAKPEQLAPLGALLFIDWIYKPNAETIKAIIQTELYPETMESFESLDALNESLKNL